MSIKTARAEDVKAAADMIAAEGLSFTATGRLCKLSPTTVGRIVMGGKVSEKSIEKLFHGLSTYGKVSLDEVWQPERDTEPNELTPPSADLDNEILRAKSIIKSYKFIQHQSKRALEEWDAWLAKLAGLYSRVDEIRKTLGIIGDKK